MLLSCRVDAKAVSVFGLRGNMFARPQRAWGISRKTINLRFT